MNGPPDLQITNQQVQEPIGRHARRWRGQRTALQVALDQFLDQRKYRIAASCGNQADPRVAIEAMQAMNASVRSAVFFPAFFLTPVVLGLTAAAMRFNGRRSPAFWFAAAALVYLTSGLFLTLAVNVPMNEALAAIAVPKDVETAREIWQDYSGRWQFWNQARTIASGIALAFAGFGLARL